MVHLIKIVEKINIAADRTLVFNYTQDYDNRLKWDTFLKRADLLNGETHAGVGVSAFCVSHAGFGMETIYVSYNPPRVTAVKMKTGPFFFRSFAGSWAFNELTPEITEVIFTYSFSLLSIFSLLSGLVRRILKRNVRQRLIDLKTCIETR